MFKPYWDNLMKLLFRPIYFFTFLPKGDWIDDSVTFVGITSSLLAFVGTIVIFITQYFVIGQTLFEKVVGWKWVFTVPTTIVLAFMFFVITFSIIFAMFLFALLALFWIISGVLFYLGRLPARPAGGQNKASNYHEYLKASFYSSGVMVVFSLVELLVILTKRGLMDFTNFSIGYNMLYSFAVLYLYGIFAIILRKLGKFEKGKAFLIAVIPAIFLALIGIAVGFVVLPKLKGLIA